MTFEEHMSKDFPVISISRESLVWEGYEAANLTDQQMHDIANRLADYLVASSLGDVLAIVSEEFNLISLDD